MIKKDKPIIRFTVGMTSEELKVLYVGYRVFHDPTPWKCFEKQVIDTVHFPVSLIVEWLQAALKEDTISTRMREIGYMMLAEFLEESSRSTPPEIRIQYIHDSEDFYALLKEVAQIQSSDITEERYPRIHVLGLSVWHFHNSKLAFVSYKHLRGALLAKGKNYSSLFEEYFGVQTMVPQGPYPHDVEAVLERIESGELTGTQLFPD